MGLKFDPKLDSKLTSKKSVAKKSKQKDDATASASASASFSASASASVSASAGALSSTSQIKRKSIANKTNKKQAKNDAKKEAKAKKIGQKEQKQLAKLQAENEKLMAKTAGARKSVGGYNKSAGGYNKSASGYNKSARYNQNFENYDTSHDTQDAQVSYVERLGDVRKRERQQRNRKKYRIYILRIVLIVALFLALIFGSIFVYRSNLFAVENVQVNGVSHLTSQEITQLAAIPDTSTLLRCDASGIVERLKEHAWVQDAKVKRKFPHTLQLEITERTAAAVVKVNSKSIWVISSDGTWLSAATKQDWKSSKKIIDVNTAINSPASGVDCNDEGIKNAIAIYAGLPQDFAKRVKTISAESAIKAQLNLKNGVVIAFGEAQDIDLKVAAAQSLLEKYSGKISYINVRVPSRPTYRTL